MNIKDDIRSMAADYASRLKRKIDDRVRDMDDDDTSHFLVYRVLGITNEEGRLIDVYQNKGRFLYRYAGSFLEDAAKHCFKVKYPESGSVRIPNTLGKRPKTFEIDCLIDSDAVEIKWRDATTDGDGVCQHSCRLDLRSLI